MNRLNDIISEGRHIQQYAFSSEFRRLSCVNSCILAVTRIVRDWPTVKSEGERGIVMTLVRMENPHFIMKSSSIFPQRALKKFHAKFKKAKKKIESL